MYKGYWYYGAQREKDEIALSDQEGKASFFVEDHGGFTNSLVLDFAESTRDMLDASQRNKTSSTSQIKIDVSTIDLVCERYSIEPDSIKIDVEGAELSVLRGAIKTLSKLRALMVEVSWRHEEVYDQLQSYGLVAHDQSGREIIGRKVGGNVFSLNRPRPLVHPIVDEDIRNFNPARRGFTGIIQPWFLVV